MNFQVGDRVSWLGLRGVVDRIDRDDFPVRVKWDKNPQGTYQKDHLFTEDGRAYYEQRPSLKEWGVK